MTSLISGMNTLARLSKQRQSLFNIRSGTALTSHENTMTRVIRAQSSQLNVLSNLLAVSAILPSSFNVRHRVVNANTAVKCNVYARVSTSLTIEMNVGQIIQDNMRTMGRDRWISMYPGR